MEVDIPGALRDLAKIAARIAELREWQRLAQEQRAAHPHRELFVPDSDQQEIDSLCGAYIQLDMIVHEALARPDLNCSPEQKKRWQRQLREMKQAVAILV